MAVDDDFKPCSLLHQALQLSGEMVEMAEQHNWDGLIHHNLYYLPVIEKVLKNIECYLEHSDSYVMNSLRLLCDAEKYMMTLLNIRMLEISKVVVHMRNSKKINNAYASQMFSNF